MRWNALRFVPLLFLLLIGFSGAALIQRGNAKPTVLHITRTILPGYSLPPLDITVHNAAAVQRLYAAAYALPPTPQELVLCPLDIGLVYHLDFFQGQVLVQQMNLSATGCLYLQLSQDRDDTRLVTGSFQSLFIKTIGIPSLVPPIPQLSPP